MEVKGYKVIPVPLSEGSLMSRFLYVKQHMGKGSQDTPEGRTLFVCNLPSDNVAESEDFLKQAFSKFGAIQSVKVDTPKEEGNQGASNLRKAIQGYVVFASPKTLKEVLSDCRALDAPPSHKPRTVQTIVQDFRKSRPKVKDLEEQADKIIKKFEEKEEQEKQELTSRKNQPDEDGFIMVLNKKRKRKGDLGDRKAEVDKRKKKKKYELKNFYTFQIKDAKMEQLERLRNKFEEDKARIARMKAARNFKPF